AELAERDMGLIADIVPNHVGIGWQNPWWRDVLRYGQRSHYAAWFDIDWEALPQVQRGVLVVPLLGRPFGEALEAGELTVTVKDGELAVCYFDHALPLAPESYRSVCELPPLPLRAELSDPGAFTRLVEVLEVMGQGERDAAEAALETWRGLLHDEPAIRQFVTERAAALNGTPGDP